MADILLRVCSILGVAHALQVQTWPNAGFAGRSNVYKINDLNGITFPSFGANSTYSAQILGSFRPPYESKATWKITCNIEGLSAFVYLDDHLVCQGGNDQATWGSYRPENLVPWSGTPAYAGLDYFLRVKILHKAGTPGTAKITINYSPVQANKPNHPPIYIGCFVDMVNNKRDLPVNAGDEPTKDSPDVCSAKCSGYKYFGLQDGDNCFCGNSYGSMGAAPASDCNMPCPGNHSIMCGAADRNSVYSHKGAIPKPIPASSFTDTLQPAQMQRLNMSRSLVHGRWSTWAKKSVTAHILLPTGLMLKFGICQRSSGSCKEDGTKGDIDSGVVRLGPHAYDHSYTQLYFKFKDANFSFETSQLGGTPGGDLVVLVTPVAPATFNVSDYAVLVIPLFTDVGVDQASWNLPGTVSVATSANGQVVATPEGEGIAPVHVYGSTSTTSSHLNPEAVHWLAWDLHPAGDPVAISTGSQRSVSAVSGLMQAAAKAELSTYSKYGEHAEAKEASQAAMMWNLQWSPGIPGTFAPVSRGWGRPWVIFDWDNIFGAYQLSFDAKELAYSQLAAVIKTKTAEGMVPNFWQPQSISYDRTEPIIGAKVLHEMYHKHHDDWIVELLYKDCYDWIDWFFRKRREPPLGLICLGSDPNLPTSDTPNMQAARYESGLDNSPMYDGEFFNTTTNHMELYDVGMSSMVAMELKALANLSVTAFDPPRTQDHALLTSRLEELSGLISQHLWDAESKIFVNKFSNGSGFYRRITPTSFYPMQAGIATAEQATAMVETWLLSPEHFCISPEGDFEGNADSCYWGLPSIQASDPAYPPLGYWRGYVWGPMIQLTYWALQAPEYAHLDVVSRGRKALVKQSTAMLANQWRLHRHVCENFNPHKDGPDCTGDRFYHWGGLAGFVSLLEAGLY